MSDQEKRLAVLMLMWSRTLEKHRMGWEEWLEKRQPRAER